MVYADMPRSNLRSFALIAYVIYGISLFTALPMLVGALIALLKKRAARGTVYESHYANMLTIFWVSLVVGLIGLLLTPILIGFAVLGLLWVWVAWRVAKGIGRLTSGQPYHDDAWRAARA